MERKKIINYNYFKLIYISAIVAALSILLASTLKAMTEYFEELVMHNANISSNIWLILLPTSGITAIYFLRKYLFRNKKNKGITEIYKTIDQRKEHLPLFKIPSHFINGFLTVVTGGSTGIEVSTVVATATVGNVGYKKNFAARTYKLELICAGVTAGVAILFGSPLAGWLFSMEVIARKLKKSVMISCSVAAMLSWIFIAFSNQETLLSQEVQSWNWHALPFFILLSLIAGLLSVYFTFLVTRVKSFFARIDNNFLRVNSGALLVGTMIFLFPVLYGDSYHGMKEMLQAPPASLIALCIIVILKPLAASLTLGAGGDGGVFAPSIVAGAFLGMLFATFCNLYFDTNLIPFNFALAGAAATLSAAIYAPFTALVLICNIAPHGYTLFVPVLLASFVSKIFAEKLLPYNAYTYDFYLSSKAAEKV